MTINSSNLTGPQFGLLRMLENGPRLISSTNSLMYVRDGVIFSGSSVYRSLIHRGCIARLPDGRYEIVRDNGLLAKILDFKRRDKNRRRGLKGLGVTEKDNEIDREVKEFSKRLESAGKDIERD